METGADVSVSNVAAFPPPMNGSSDQSSAEPGRSDSPPDIGGMVFEDIFYNTLTQRTALELFQQQTQNSRMFKKTEGVEVEEESSPSSRLRPRACKKQVVGKDNQNRKKGSLLSSTGASSCKNDPEENQPSENYTQGIAMVEALLARYDARKKELKDKSVKFVMPSLDDGLTDSSEVEELSESDDDCPNSKYKSDFLKYSVPQYDLKIKLCQMHCSVIESMSPDEVGMLCEEIVPQLKEIRNELLPSKRHEMFKTYGNSKHSLREMIVAKPFSTAQDNCVMNVINERMFLGEDTVDNNGELLHYISLVLLPEALIRIYSKVNKMDYQYAEKELRFGAGYDGELPPDVVNALLQN